MNDLDLSVLTDQELDNLDRRIDQEKAKRIRKNQSLAIKQMKAIASSAGVKFEITEKAGYKTKTRKEKTGEQR